MNMLIVSPEAETELAARNAAGESGRQLRPVLLIDGRTALNADLLSDCDAGQTWAHYRDFLQMLAVDAVEETNLPQSSGL